MSSYNTPKEIAVLFCQSGVAKAAMPVKKFIVLAILGGIYIAFGGLLYLMVAGGMPTAAAENPGIVKFLGGAMFPIGLIMVTVAGADLFTSDCAAMVLPVMQKELRVTSLLRIWGLSYLFNFVGAIAVAYFFAYQTGFVTSSPWKEFLHNSVYIKTHSSFFTVFIKGIGANWLVCLGAWMGFAGKDIVSKSVGIWIPVMLFVTLGFEHSIANMFFVPAGIFSGAAVSWVEFGVNNLIPATLGNILGGAFFVGCAYWYIYLKGENGDKASFRA